MMDRRLFLGSWGGLTMFGNSGAAPAADEKRTRYYMLRQFFLKNGTQMPRLHEFFSKVVVPALNKVHGGPKIYLEALVAPHMPQLAVIHGFRSLEELESVQAKAGADPELRAALEQLESAPEPPFEHQTATLLEAAPYSPEIVADTAARKAPRIFELRTYHSPTFRQLRALHERFAGPEIKIFHRVGVHPILYASTLAGSQIPNLTYVIPFPSLAEREKAWTAFGADPEWMKVRKESIDRHGQISSVIQISLYRAAPYSPVG